MKLLSLELENFQSFEEESIDFSKLMVASICGSYDNNSTRSNGVGKSTIFDAILYAIYGKSRTQSEDDLIMNGKENMSVQFDFLLNGEQIQIIRKKSRENTGSLYFSVNGKDISEGKRETQDSINRKIGMDFDLFVATIFFQQMGADTFTAATPAIRKQYLKGILQLDVYDRALEEAKEKYDSYEEEVTKLESQLSYIEEQKEVDIKQLKKDFADNKDKIEQATLLIKTYETKLKEYESIKNSVNTIIKEGKQLRQRKDECSQEIVDAHASIKELEKEKELEAFDDTQLDIISKEIKQAREKVNAMNEKSVEIKTTIKNLKDKLSILDGKAICPTCDSKLGEETSEKICSDMKLQIESYTERYQASLALVKELQDSLMVKERKESTLRKAQLKYKDDLKDEEIRKNNLKNEKEKLSKLELEDNKLTERIVVLRSKLEEERAKVKTEYDDDTLEKMRDEKESLVVSNNSIKKSIGDYENQQEQIAELKKQIKQSRKMLNIYTTLKNIFNKNGIVAEIIQNSIDDIQDVTNQILSDINEGEMKVIFETTKEVKADKILRDTLDIKIETEMGERNYESFSGGEKTIINFSIRLALSKMISKMNGVNFGFIVLDEVFGALDEYNREKMSRVINYLKNDFNQIFLISHDEMKERFSNYIRIEKNHRTGVSKIVEIF